MEGTRGVGRGSLELGEDLSWREAVKGGQDGEDGVQGLGFCGGLLEEGRHDFDEVEVCRRTAEDFTAQVLHYALKSWRILKETVTEKIVLKF